MMSVEYYTIEKTAEVLSITPAEVNRLRESGKLRGFRDGTSWKFAKEQVHNSLAESIKARNKASESDIGLAEEFNPFDTFDDPELPNDSDLVAVDSVKPKSEIDLASIIDDDDGLKLVEETHGSSYAVPNKVQEPVEEYKLAVEPINKAPELIYDDVEEKEPSSIPHDSGFEIEPIEVPTPETPAPPVVEEAKTVIPDEPFGINNWLEQEPQYNPTLHNPPQPPEPVSVLERSASAPPPVQAVKQEPVVLPQAKNEVDCTPHDSTRRQPISDEVLGLILALAMLILGWGIYYLFANLR